METNWGKLPHISVQEFADIDPEKSPLFRDKEGKFNPPWTHINDFQELILYGLRKLGAPITNVELHDDQIKDIISDALLIYLEDTVDSLENFHIALKVTRKDIDRGYMLMLPDVVDVIDVWNVNRQTNMFGPSYEMFNSMEYLFKSAVSYGSIGLGASDLYDVSSYYAILDTTWSMVRGYFNPVVAFNWIPREKRLYLYKEFKEGNVIILEVAKQLNPEKDKSIWNSRFMRKYVPAAMGKQYGINIAKFSNIATAGNLTVNASEIIARYSAEMEKVELEYKAEFKEPPYFFIG